jgi:ankyrin repeat protein
MSALYGAAGVAHDPELTRVLLEAGADPDDGESLYHATEARETDCLRLLLELGAATSGTNGLAHALDYEAEHALAHARLLLEAGADPNEAPLVAHCVRRGGGPEAIRLLAAFGADLDRPGGETWRGDAPLRTPYQHAVLWGRVDVAEALAGLGASTVVSEDDDALSALARGERPRTPLPESLDYDQQEVAVLAALRGHLDAVVDAVGPDFRGVVGGSPEGSLLHHAAWIGSPELVTALLDLGAEPAGGADPTESPLAWAAHGSHHHGLKVRDYVAVAEILAAAGNAVEPEMLELADGPL